MKKWLGEYGMLLVLLFLCALFSLLTLKQQSATGSAAAARVAATVEKSASPSDAILVIGAAKKPSSTLAAMVKPQLEAKGLTNVSLLVGTPRDLKLLADSWSEDGDPAPKHLIISGDVESWTVLEGIRSSHPEITWTRPRERWQSDFLKGSNLVAIVDRIVVIAVIAIGMTLVILTGGIDLSVGSLIAFAAVLSTLLMKALGGLTAPSWSVWLGFLAATMACGGIGASGGFLVAQFRVAPFITTLAIMMMARGFAFLLTGGFSIYQVPDSLTWLGQGRTLGIPNTVILLMVLYTVAHLFMSQTRWGRYIYAVGGNEEAARLSGVPVKGVLIFVYLVAGLCAGFGGCIQASQLGSGAPNLGMMFELYVIAAVVVGGTSLSGGTGKIMGTLIGAFIISVIQNGMNLLGFDSYLQQVVLGAVILVAVLLDKLRQGGTGIRWLRA